MAFLNGTQSLRDRWLTRQTRASKRRQRLRRTHFEQLEDRRMLANLAFEEVLLTAVDDPSNELATVASGQVVTLRVQYRAEDLSETEEFRIRYEIGNEATWSDGLRFSPAGTSNNVDQWSHGENWWKTTFTWPHQEEPQRIRIDLDAGDDVVESIPVADNIGFSVEIASVTFKSTQDELFVNPVDGVTEWDWDNTTDIRLEVGNYVDVDPRQAEDRFSGVDVRDFRGNRRTYDGHDALDVGVANFALADQGVTIVAAAAGTVLTAINDDWSDRNRQWGTPGGGNGVVIDHGGGWTTAYWHMRHGSVTVEPGDVVHAGDVLGLMASSGSSTGAHLHFGIIPYPVMTDALSKV